MAERPDEPHVIVRNYGDIFEVSARKRNHLPIDGEFVGSLDLAFAFAHGLATILKHLCDCQKVEIINETDQQTLPAILCTWDEINNA
ncbi:hypothetical protein KKA15_03810 [Patescibacteria group bacterium]|nr:hypothetical protein [Patescibacteria group bacterium]